MKLVLNWHGRPGAEAAQNVRSMETLLHAFSGWAPPETISISEFVTRVDGRGGTLVVTTDDIAAVNHMTSQFSAWFDWDVNPVVDVAEGAAQAGEATAWAKRATG
jgi:hypothetical protein